MTTTFQCWFEAMRGDMGIPQLWKIVDCNLVGRRYVIQIRPERITGQELIEWSSRREGAGSYKLARVVIRCIIGNDRIPERGVESLVSQVIGAAPRSGFKLTRDQVLAALFPKYHWRRLIGQIVGVWTAWRLPYRVNRNGADSVALELLMAGLTGHQLNDVEIIQQERN